MLVPVHAYRETLLVAQRIGCSARLILPAPTLPSGPVPASSLLLLLRCRLPVRHTDRRFAP
jgi:hypothetical protein